MRNLPEQQAQQNMPMVIDILPVNMEAEIQRAKQARLALDKLFKELLVQGTDFDRVPGTDKPTLLKPGAELLCQVFHLAPGRAEMIAREEDFQNGILSYTIGIPIYHRETGVLVAYGIGAANSKEPKYRYRKEKSGDEEIRVENPDPGGQQNTLVKMAAKRALVDGVLKATGASRMFTQDVEDFMVPEKASSKQLNYIKMLFKGMAENDILSAIGQILGRELTGWDLTRDEASRVIEVKKGETNSQTTRHDSTPKPKTNGNSLNWSAFWGAIKHLDRAAVHDEAKRFFNQPDLKSLTDVIKTQEDLDAFLDYLKQAYAAD